MNLKSRRFAVVIFAIFACLAGLTVVMAQMGGEFAEHLAENNKKLKEYTYLQKTEVYLKGQLKSTKLDQVHYDATTGQKVSVPLNGGAGEQAQQEAGGGRRGRLAGRMMEKKIEEKKDEMKEYVERLTGMMHQYLPPNADRVKAALPHSDITPPAGGVAKIALHDYLKPGDVMNLSIDPGSRAITQIFITSKLDDDPVSYLVSFSKLPDGTNYPALTSIKSEPKELEIRVTTSDYHK
jgi:hypothetical protein